MPFDLLIWDCDGCLVDSEVIACAVVAERLTSLGYPLTGPDYALRFAGKTTDYAVDEIERETGQSFADRFSYLECRAKILEAFETHLTPTAGVHEALSQLDLPMCIASGSGVERNTKALRLTNLLPFFEGRIFSSSQVPNGKPAPDVFLFAADQMKADPSRCLVIEDSVYGVQAAQAAGMKVFGYMGGGHVTEKWRESVLAACPDLLFDDMQVLPDLVASFA